MKNIINLQCHDLHVFACIQEKIFINFVGYDLYKKESTNVVVPIHEQIDEIYRNKKDKHFLQRLVYKLKLTMRLNPVDLTFEKENGFWLLKTPFTEIYKVVTLTPDGTKMGDDPLTIDGKMLNIFSYKGSILLKCLVQEIDSETNDLLDKVKIVKISNEFNSIYNNKEIRARVREQLKIKSRSKRTFIEVLSEYLDGKDIKVEYDEHYEYTLWTAIEDMLDAN